MTPHDEQPTMRVRFSRICLCQELLPCLPEAAPASCAPPTMPQLSAMCRGVAAPVHCVHVSPTPAGFVYAPEQLPVQSSQTALGKPLTTCIM